MSNVFKISGISSMVGKLRKIQSMFPDEVAKALLTRAEVDVATPAKRRVFRKHGLLRNSIHVQGPFREGRLIVVKVVAGGPAAPQALALHEHPDNREYSPPSWKNVGDLNPTTAGTGNKYIEIPMLEATPGMADSIAAEIDLGRMV